MSDLISRLRDYANQRKGELADLVNEAADALEKMQLSGEDATFDSTSDLISRQAAIDAMEESKTLFHDRKVIIGKMQDIVNNLPSVQEREEKTNEWCHDCKEYDQERHCCPRWNRVIRNTVKEIMTEHRWIPVTERLPKHGQIVLITNDKGNVRSGRFRGVEFWKDDVDAYWIFKGNTVEHVVAWMPLPDPYKGEK